MALKVGSTEITDVLLKDGTVIDSIKLKDGTVVYEKYKDYTDASFGVSTSFSPSSGVYVQYSKRANGAIYGLGVRTFTSARASATYSFTMPKGYVAYSCVKSNGNIGKTYVKEGTPVTISASGSASSDGYNEAWAHAWIQSVSFYTS